MHIEEHKGFSFRYNNFKLTRTTKSSVRNHSELEKHSLSCENFDLIDASPVEYDLHILESLWIWKEKTNLDEYISSTDIEFLK